MVYLRIEYRWETGYAPPMGGRISTCRRNAVHESRKPMRARVASVRGTVHRSHHRTAIRSAGKNNHGFVQIRRDVDRISPHGGGRDAKQAANATMEPCRNPPSS